MPEGFAAMTRDGAPAAATEAPAEQFERRLAAILVADVVGYSALMGVDEAATLLKLQEHRFSLLDPTIGQHRGRIVKSMGDGLLVVFHSVREAVSCAMAIQTGMVARNAGVPEDKQIRFRVGIHLDDVLVEQGDVFGDGVNIAARLQEVAQPNGVSISGLALGHLDADLGQMFTDMGAHQFKNIARPIRVFHYSPDPAASPVHAAFRPFVDLPEDSQATTTGGCMCGAIRYEASGKALGSMLCQCRMCQKFSGAPILGGTTFLARDLQFSRGSPRFFRSSDIAERGFCADCGTALVYRGLIGIWTSWIMVFTASLDQPEKFPPTYHMGIESAMPWLEIHDDLPRSRCEDSPSLVEAYRSVGQEVP